VADDTNSQMDVFLRDRQTNVTTRISLSSTGEQGNNTAFGIAFPSEDGRYVFFESYATNLTPSDTSGLTVGYIRDTQTNTTSRVSVDSPNPEAAYMVIYDISPDMRYVSFVTSEMLVAEDTNNLADVYLLDRQTDTVSLISGADDTRPTLIAPTNGASVTNPNATFSWNSVASATDYQIQIATDNTFASIVHDHTLTATSYAYTLPSAGIYYWRVLANNINGSGEWSNTYQFTIEPPPLDPTALLLPIHGHFATEATLEFSWASVENATHYQIQISTNSYFTDIIYDDSITMTHVTHT
ncbi:MAG TPA: hypothetical protein PLZ51_07895, partial [Aggregatilineales bacterium]|nr:hypothetical protein [Aggregatilineales bacterium]